MVRLPSARQSCGGLRSLPILNLGSDPLDACTWIQLVPASGSGSARTLYSHMFNLWPNSPMHFTQTVTIPADIATGTCNVVIETDYGDIVDETDETNNTAVWNLQVNAYGCTCASGGSSAAWAVGLLPLALLVGRRR